MYFLLIHENSYRFIASVAQYMERLLGELTGSPIQRRVAARVQDCRFPGGSVVFVIGESFPPFVKCEMCRYVFLNFSVLYVLRGLFSCSLAGRRWIRGKHALFMEKAACFDGILDFYRPQCELIRRDLHPLGIPVEPFLVNVAIDPQVIVRDIDSRPWDVCVVGTCTPRRMRVYRELLARGLKLSPFETDDLSQVMADSKVLLNLHGYRCDNLEAPRIIHAMKAGVCVVTEDSYGLESLVPRDCCCIAGYRRLADCAHALLGDRREMDELAARAGRYMQSEYEQRTRRAWAAILEVVSRL